MLIWIVFIYGYAWAPSTLTTSAHKS